MASSSLLLFLVSSVWVTLFLPLMLMPAEVAADVQGYEDCPPVLCGSVNISSPFGLIPNDGTDEPTRCGGQQIGFQFQITCVNSIPYFGSYQSEYSLRILSIFYHNTSLLVADTYRRHPYFNRSSTVGCQIPTNGTFNQLARPFLVSPFNQKLIFYRCTKPPPSGAGAGLVETVCGNNTFVRAAADGRPDEPASNYSLEGCTITALVPVLGLPGKVNASNYQQLVSDGYLATWQWSPPAGNFTLGTTLHVHCGKWAQKVAYG